MKRCLFAFAWMSCAMFGAAEQKGQHSPYTIGPAIRNLEKGTIVIPVHFYWQKGEKNTRIDYDLRIKLEGKIHEVRSQDVFVTESQTGSKSMVLEYTIRDWKPTLGENRGYEELKTAKSLDIFFVGTADGVTQKIETTINVADFPSSSPKK